MLRSRGSPMKCTGSSQTLRRLELCCCSVDSERPDLPVEVETVPNRIQSIPFQPLGTRTERSSRTRGGRQHKQHRQSAGHGEPELEPGELGRVHFIQRRHPTADVGNTSTLPLGGRVALARQGPRPASHVRDSRAQEAKCHWKAETGPLLLAAAERCPRTHARAPPPPSPPLDC